MQERCAADQNHPRGDESLRTIFTASAGLFGVQVVWGLQNVSTSRIFQTLGASVADLPMLWVAAPLTGLLVQPIVGHYSDRLSSRFGRRRPFIAVGALACALGMVMLGFARSLGAAVFGLWLLTASANLAMQPLRALLADLLPADRRVVGYAVQVLLIGSGAVLASAMPWLLGHLFGVTANAPPGELPATVSYAFAIGAALVLVTALISLLAPDRPILKAAAALDLEAGPSAAPPRKAIVALFILGGAGLAVAATLLTLRKELYLLSAVAIVYGLALQALRQSHADRRPVRGLLRLVSDIASMPDALRRLALVQFFTWFGLFTLWVYAVPAVASRNADRVGAAGYNASADRVGLFFAFFDATAIFVSLGLPWVARRIGLTKSHRLALAFGAAGLSGLALTADTGWSWIPAVGIGIAWASILSAPYALVANGVPQDKVGVYLGIHNIFLVVPQLLAATTLGVITDRLEQISPMAMVWVAAGSIFAAAIAVRAESAPIPAR